jgi:AraC family transcriptional regulator
MEPRIEIIPEKKFVGKRIKMSFDENKTLDLWTGFMPRRKEIRNFIGQELYSIEVYEPFFFTSFDPDRKFDKWAVVEVTDFDSVPSEMETLISPRGLYAVFVHIGTANRASETYNSIFNAWLPKTDYQIDTRPHLAIMGDKYKGDDPGSEEELLIPIKR